MAKNLKLTIKNTQIAEAINLDSLKNKLASKKAPSKENVPAPKKTAKASSKGSKAEPVQEEIKEETPKIKARSRSAFAEPHAASQSAAPAPAPVEPQESLHEATPAEEEVGSQLPSPSSPLAAKEELETHVENTPLEATEEPIIAKEISPEPPSSPQPPPPVPPAAPVKPPLSPQQPYRASPPSSYKPYGSPSGQAPRTFTPPPRRPDYEKLGPTGRHIRDVIPPKPAPKPRSEMPQRSSGQSSSTPQQHPARSGPLKPPSEEGRVRTKTKEKEDADAALAAAETAKKAARFKEFKDVKPAKKESQRFDSRDRQGLRSGDDEGSQHWKRRKSKAHRIVEDTTIRPTSLKVRMPISIKDLANEMKLKSSQLVQKLFLQGVVVTLNDLLEDETTIQLLGGEFGCEISIDTSEEERIRITDQTVKAEIQASPADELIIRPPVVAFMGHVDHGKTSLIDSIRASNRVASEAGAITQHIGAFKCKTAVGDIAILDTPGHEAFSAMRARGADVTDIVVLVVAGDEGIKQQTVEAIQHAKAAGVTIVVAINKADKPNFNPENVYRQLAENELLPESWGGQTITVNCSAVTGQGIDQLLEMLALQAEVLELKASPTARARGSVLESEMHKGLGATTTVLVQNGTLHKGDCLVFGTHWGRVKTMFDEHNIELIDAGPSTPVRITGLSGLPEAGEEFIVVKNEKEAREISEARVMGQRQFNFLQKKKLSMENLFQQASDSTKKILNIVLRADVQGSLEALKAALLKIESAKVDLNIIFAGVGEVSESDVQLAAASKAIILGFHTQVESHAESLLKQLGVQVKLHNIIYHAIDDMKLLMTGLLDKIAQETERGKAEVKATFKSSQHGVIAGCQVTEGVIQRNNQVRIRRDQEVVWKGNILSLKRVKEDVKEVQKGFECGILLNGFNEVKEGDVIEAYEITYLTQEL